MNSTQIQSNKKAKIIPFIIALLGSVAVVAAFFLPFASASGDYREMLSAFSYNTTVGGVNISASEAADISMFSFARIYTAIGGSFGIVYGILIYALGALSALTLIFAIFKKAIPTIIFDIATLAALCLMIWDFSDRGLLPSDSYNYGAGFYIYLLGLTAALVGSIWLLIVKIKQKRQLKAINNSGGNQ